MCAYKLCKVEFRYWGMQTKLEKFIHDVGKFYCNGIILYKYKLITMIVRNLNYKKN